jgi:hypothetical protein
MKTKIIRAKHKKETFQNPRLKEIFLRQELALLLSNLILCEGGMAKVVKPL